MRGGRACVLEHRILHREPYAYCAHPFATALADGTWLLVFNHAPRRPFILHPPQDPWFHNLLARSTDQGRTWTPPVPVPDFGWDGVECAGLTPLPGGRVLLNQWRFRWYPLPLARKLAGKVALAMPADWARELAGSTELDSGRQLGDPEALVPWARGPGQTFAHLSDDGGLTFGHTVQIDTRPYSGGYGMRGGLTLGDGSIFLPLSDVPAYERVFSVRSTDGGLSWKAPRPVAAEPGLLFEEPAPLALPTGDLLILLRENRGRTLHAVRSADGGQSWSRPAPTGIDGYPAHLLGLSDGCLLCTFGRRKPPFSIRAVVSTDSGESWSAEELPIRPDLPNKDLGYPVTLAAENGELATFYYGQDQDGVTAIWMTRWRLE